MALVNNLVIETANAPGVGDVTLLGALPGRIAFSAVKADATATFYFLADAVQAEWGVGAYLATPQPHIRRDTVIGNTAGTTAKLNFAGSVLIYDEVPAERTLSANFDNLTVPLGSRQLTGLGYGAAGDHAPRLDQLAWERLGSAIFGTSQTVVVFSLPAGFDRYRLEWQDFSPVAGPGQPYLRISNDGGATYLAGAASYYANGAIQVGTTITAGAGAGSYLVAGSANTTTAMGEAIFKPSAPVHVRLTNLSSTPSVGIDRSDSVAIIDTAARLTHVLLGFVGLACATGNIRLSGTRI